MICNGQDADEFWHKLILQFDSLETYCENGVRRLTQNSIADKSTLVQVMVWYHQATSHYLSPSWLRSLLPYDVTKPQWVNTLGPGKIYPNLQKASSDAFEKDSFFLILTQMSMNFVPKGAIDNKSTFICVMAWHWISNKPYITWANDGLVYW